MKPLIKICGLTRAADVSMAVRAGADWLGLNFWPPSPRYISVAQGIRLAQVARAESESVRLVGVFVNQDEDEVAAIAGNVGLDFLQFHGDEPAQTLARFSGRAIRALGVSGPADIVRVKDNPCQTVVVDAPSAGYGGSGRTFSWDLARDAVATGKRIVLAGGLTPDNVAHAIRQVAPYGVDVASGVESAPGLKDAGRVRAFIAAAREESSDD